MELPSLELSVSVNFSDREQCMSKKSKAGKVLAVGLIAGLVAVLVAVWKASKPIEDPWENEPLPAHPHQPAESREASVEEIREILEDDK